MNSKIARLMIVIRRNLRNLANDYGNLSTEEFFNKAKEIVAEGIEKAYLLGVDEETIKESKEQLDREIQRLVNEQFKYLNNWQEEVEQSDELFVTAPSGRLLMYSGAAYSAFEIAKTRGWDLPYYPGDGSTECLTNCRCQWRLLPGADVKSFTGKWQWIRNAEESCPTCIRRENIVITNKNGKRV